MTWLTADFGLDYALLTTVGVAQLGAGGVLVARTTVGVIAMGNGLYALDATLDPTAVAVQWDTGTSPPIYASETIAQLPSDPGIIAAAVLAAAQIAPIHSNVKMVNGNSTPSGVSTLL